MLRLEKLEKQYKTGDRALKGLDLEIPDGQVMALIGPSGAGKSTLIRCVNRLVEPTNGRVFLNESELTALNGGGLRKARRRMGMIFQEYALVERLTVMENVLSGRLGYTGFWRSYFRKFPQSDIDEAFRLLERVGLGDALDRRIGTYSKGMRQRLGLAQVLLGQPKLALLDEPTSGLDPISRQDLYAIINELAEQGAAVLIASHALTEVEARTDRIAILRKGLKVADDTLAGLSAQAGLPVKLRVQASGAQADRIAIETGGRRINGASVEVLCRPQDKMAELRKIAAMGDAVADIDMVPPRLDDLYRHYSNEELN